MPALLRSLSGVHKERVPGDRTQAWRNKPRGSCRVRAPRIARRNGTRERSVLPVYIGRPRSIVTIPPIVLALAFEIMMVAVVMIAVAPFIAVMVIVVVIVRATRDARGKNRQNAKQHKALHISLQFQ